MSGVRERGGEPGPGDGRGTAARRSARRSPSGFTVTVASTVAFVLLFYTVPNVAAVWRAARADGTPGAFTAERVECVRHPGHESCTWYGSFAAAGGAEARGTSMYGAGRGDLSAGERVPAIDVGRSSRVYPPDGSREWIPTGLALLAAAGLCRPLARRVLNRMRRPRRARRSGTPAG
ncbi:hypothetical protein ACN3XK_30075 [Actinomadura welshii]